MTLNDVNQLLKSRLDYEQKNPGPYAGPAGDMGLEVGDILCAKGWYAIGWTKREIDNTPHVHIATEESKVDFLNYLRDYWLAIWNGGPNPALERRLKQVEQLKIIDAKRKAEDAKREAEDAKREAADEKYYKDYLDRWGPPKAYRFKTFANFKAETPTQKTALQVAEWFPYYGPYDDDDDGQPTYLNVVLAGPTGVGKTHLAAALYKGRWENDCSAEFVTASAFIRKFSEKVDKESVLLARYGDDKYEPADRLDNGCNTLVVDDLGRETDIYASRIFCEILDRRMGAELQSIFTTNLTPVEMRTWLGEPGYSRLLNRCLWIDLDGDDRRLRDPRSLANLKDST
jgi:DNA replication protein DnaC